MMEDRMTVEDDEMHDVVVVGAGPVGLMLANILGMYGRSVAVLEAGDDLIDYPRGVGLDDESFRTIQTVGLVETVLPHTTPHHIMRLVNGAGNVLLVNDPATTEFGWGRKHGFIQPEVDRALLNGLRRFDDVVVLFGHNVFEVAEDEESVTVTARVKSADGSTAERRVRARYLVGCDGGKSPTRKRLGIGFDGHSPSTRWLVVDVANDPLGTPNVFLGADHRRPYVSIGLPHAVRRFEFMLHDGETDDMVTDQSFVNALLAKHVRDPATLTYIRRRVFTHHARVATEFRRGRQLIAGDAAHLMPVWLGQGWNSGMRDATNLGWKLATVLSGQANDALLDTYSDERRDHARAMVDLSLTFGRFIAITNPVLARARDAASALLNLSPRVKSYFADMRFKPMPRYTRGVLADPTTMQPGVAAPRLTSRQVAVRTANIRQSPVGVQFPQPRVTTETHTNVLLDDMIGPWWAVVAWGNNPHDLLPPRSLDALHALGARIIAVVPENQREWLQAEWGQKRLSADLLVVGDHTGALKRWFDDRPTPLIFVRPDRFVAGACLAQDAPATLDAILTAMSFTGAATAPATAQRVGLHA
jgi:3-(3-hydroxy-phenyl)propionate hydroxylase